VEMCHKRWIVDETVDFADIVRSAGNGRGSPVVE